VSLLMVAGQVDHGFGKRRVNQFTLSGEFCRREGPLRGRMPLKAVTVMELSLLI